MPQLCQEMSAGAAAIVLTEEALVPSQCEPFLAALGRQPQWSDIPVIVLMHGSGTGPKTAPCLERIDNLVLLPRPIQVNALLTAIRSARRARRRQYQMRETEAALRAARDDLARANKELEHKVQERTAELNELVQELEQFSYTITHDMRAPLRALHGFSRLLVSECGQCEQLERRDLLRRIGEASTRMDSLITDALNYNKAVREQLGLEPVDAKALLHSMLESYPEFYPHKADIQVEGDVPILLGNKAGLTQCFSNLLNNAIKFVQPGQVPRIRVSAENDGEFVRLNFQDNGIGIPKEYQEQIWEMFQQLSKDYQGTGIGLALVRKVMHRMGGKVGVKSEAGKGSCFWLELKRHNS